MLIYANYDSDQYVNINKGAQSMIDTHSLSCFKVVDVNVGHATGTFVGTTVSNVTFSKH